MAKGGLMQMFVLYYTKKVNIENYSSIKTILSTQMGGGGGERSRKNHNQNNL